MISIEPGSQQSLQIGCYVIFIIAMIIVGLRLYARLCVVRQFGADDYLIVFSTLASIGIIVTVPDMYRLGIGRHAAELTMHELLYSRKWAWVSQILYYASLGLSKTSMVALYLRLASDPTHIRFLYIFGAIVFCHGIAATITTICICTPISIMWSPTFPVGCINILSFNYFNAAFHILTDILLAVLPIPIIKKLQMTRRRKLGLMIAFGVGAMTICMTVARQVTNAISLTKTDFPWYWSAAELCTCLEVNMGLICTSVPAMRSLFKVFSGDSSYRNGRSYELDSNPTDFNRLEESKKQTRSHIFSRGSTKSNISNSSETKIIPNKKNNVVQTTEFQISYT